MRQFLTIVIPLLLPTLLYFGYLSLVRRRSAGAGAPVASADIPWIWLAGAGVLLLAVTLMAIALFGGAEPGSHFESPKLIDGQVQPGGFSN